MRSPVARQPLNTNATRQQDSVTKPLPPPVGGWDAISSLADMPEDRAIVLDNWFPSTSDVRVRRGYQVHASALGTSVVESLLVYNGVTSASSKLFGAANSTIYDITVAGPATSSLTSLSNNRWQSANFTTSGGHFL